MALLIKVVAQLSVIIDNTTGYNINSVRRQYGTKNSSVNRLIVGCLPCILRLPDDVVRSTSSVKIKHRNEIRTAHLCLTSFNYIVNDRLWDSCTCVKMWSVPVGRRQNIKTCALPSSSIIRNLNHHCHQFTPSSGSFNSSTKQRAKKPLINCFVGNDHGLLNFWGYEGRLVVWRCSIGCVFQTLGARLYLSVSILLKSDWCQ